MAKFMTHFSIKGISHNGYKISIHHFCITICISVFYPFGGGGGGVCATQQGTVFTFLTLEKGVKITLHLWRRGKCYLSMTPEQKLFNFFA